MSKESYCFDDELYCQLYTRHGKECPFKAKTTDPHTGKKVCFTHSNMCEKRYKTYKQICGSIWNEKCLSNTSNEKLKEYIDFAQECKEQRIEFGHKCVKTMDQGHKGAITKMGNIVKYCKDELKRRK